MKEGEKQATIHSLGKYLLRPYFVPDQQRQTFSTPLGGPELDPPLA